MTEILALFYKVLNEQKKDLEDWKDMSEWTLITKFWSNLFETLFLNTDLKLVWGDTKSDMFAVDLRICVKMGNSYHDVANVEFKKNYNKAKTASKNDMIKVALEAKNILNNTIKSEGLSSTAAFKKASLVCQVYGLKAVFKQMSLIAPGACTEDLERLSNFQQMIIKYINSSSTLF